MRGAGRSFSCWPTGGRSARSPRPSAVTGQVLGFDDVLVVRVWRRAQTARSRSTRRSTRTEEIFGRRLRGTPAGLYRVPGRRRHHPTERTRDSRDRRQSPGHETKAVAAFLSIAPQDPTLHRPLQRRPETDPLDLQRPSAHRRRSAGSPKTVARGLQRPASRCRILHTGRRTILRNSRYFASFGRLLICWFRVRLSGGSPSFAHPRFSSLLLR